MGAVQSGDAVEVEQQVAAVPSAGRKRLMISQGVVPPKDQEQFDTLMEKTHFTRAQMDAMLKEFGSTSYQIGLNKQRFGDVMEHLGLFGSAHKHGFTKDQLVDVFFGMFDADHDGAVDFQEFVSGVACLLKGDLEEKAQMLFRLYDINNDGRISRAEMAAIVKKFMETTIKMKKFQYNNMMKFIGEEAMSAQYEELSAETVTDDMIAEIIGTAFDRVDVDGNNSLSQEEFVSWVKTSKAMHAQMFKLGFKFLKQ